MIAFTLSPVVASCSFHHFRGDAFPRAVRGTGSGSGRSESETLSGAVFVLKYAKGRPSDSGRILDEFCVCVWNFLSVTVQTAAGRLVIQLFSAAHTALLHSVCPHRVHFIKRDPLKQNSFLVVYTFT